MHINAVDSLSYSGYDKRNQFLNKTDGKDLFVPPKINEEGEKTIEATDDKANAEIKANMDKLIMEMSAMTVEEKTLNMIEIIPADLQVATSGIWKKKDKSKIKDYKEYEATCDWTYSSAYKGTVKYLSDSAKKIMDETNLEIDFNKDGAKNTLSVLTTPEA